ncbi:hypothetical protein ABBQ38_005073 [Trebouxia sp. C0009 RCD-2024]
MIAGAGQAHVRGFDVAQLHMPAGLLHSSVGGWGVEAPHAGATFQPSHGHAQGANGGLDVRPMANTGPASPAQSEDVQPALHPHQHMSGATTHLRQDCNSSVGPSIHRNPAAIADDASDAACPQVQYGEFTSLASGAAFMGPSMVSQAARDRMSRFASEDPASIHREPGGPDQPWQPSAVLQTDQAQHGLLPTSTAAGSCPPVQFGVFTNLTTGSRFARPSTRAADAMRRMQGFVTEQPCGEPGHEPQKPQSGKQHPGKGQPTGLLMAAASAVMNPLTAATAATGAAFVTPATSAGPAFRMPAAAIDPVRPTITDPRATAVSDTTCPGVMHTAVTAGPADADPGAAGGSCPPVQFGVFTNLKSGGMYAPPGKLSQHAKQRAHEMFAAGTLDWPAPGTGPAVAPATAAAAATAAATPGALAAAPATAAAAAATAAAAPGALAATAGKAQSTLQQPTSLQPAIATDQLPPGICSACQPGT